MIETCDGSVSGTVARALVNFVPRAATASIDGVNPRPMRSARNVSMVMRRMLGGAAGDGGVRVHAANTHKAIIATRFTPRLSPHSTLIAVIGSTRAARPA